LRIRFSPAVAVCLTLIVALVGCGGGASHQLGERTSTGATSSEVTPPASNPDRPVEGEEEAAEKKHIVGAKDEKPAKEVTKPARKRNRGAESKAAQGAIERVERLQQQASRSLTRKDLEEMAERAQAQAERLVDPPPGKTVEDVAREIQEAAMSKVP
jgi:hypothetical protein